MCFSRGKSEGFEWGVQWLPGISGTLCGWGGRVSERDGCIRGPGTRGGVRPAGFSVVRCLPSPGVEDLLPASGWEAGLHLLSHLLEAKKGRKLVLGQQPWGPCSSHTGLGI